MLISCTSCHSNYLLNSADIKPSGRMVECAKCGNQWFQDNKLAENDEIFYTSVDKKDLNKNSISQSNRNLPSTYVKDQQVSILNSVLVILFVIIFLSSFFLLRNLEPTTFNLLKFYISEFYFNLKLILDDLAKIIHHLLN
jgi:predicted Zn finger-like uncharacterized protein